MFMGDNRFILNTGADAAEFSYCHLLGKMEVSCGISFGKKSQTVTRNGTVEEAAQKQKPEVSPAVTEDFAVDRQIYSVCIVGHASRKDLKQQMPENESDNSSRSKKRELSDSRHDFDHLFSSDFNDDLPHPSKLRKGSSKKQAKINRLIERHMCVNNHLHQLRRRNTKYEQHKLEEQNKSSFSCDSNSHSLPVPDFPSDSIDTPNFSLEQTTSTSLPFQPQGIDFNFMKKNALSKHLFPPGSVLVSASLEQEEEDKRFQQLWKPRCNSQSTEE